jgi:predicted flap endonuclease-1-like 5' DNA nuclease
MSIAEDLWLRGQAAQRNFLHIATYGSAFAGTATLQGLHLGLMAPRGFWAAMARAAANPPPGAVAQVLPFPVVAPAADPAPVIEAAPAVTDTVPAPLPQDAPRGGAADDLTVLAGIGPKLAAALNAAGITRIDQIAALDEDAIARLEARQKGFRMLCARHDLVGQARARG